MNIEKRLKFLEKATTGGKMCMACFVAEGDGFGVCVRPELEHGLRCGRWPNHVHELSNRQLEEVVAARAMVEGMTFDEYMAKVEKEMGDNNLPGG